MNIQPYLDRIEYKGNIEPNLETLSSLLRRHVFSVPFENLDVQLGRALTIKVEDAYEKIVVNGRGGWCYEQNGLFGWALLELGFSVTRIAAGVMREQKGDSSAASHLTLIVACPGSSARYLVDVGFGGSMVAPIALEDAEHSHSPFEIGLQKLDDCYWRFWEDLGDGRFTYDFAEEAADETALAEKCDFLQIDPASSFVQNLVAQIRTSDQYRVLRGRVFTVAKPGSRESMLLDSPAALVEILATEYRLDVPEIADLWPRIVERHNLLFGDSRIQ